jgi:DNA (cytosine-5)-methyltransferase 1
MQVGWNFRKGQGAGGLDYGFEAAGFKIALALDQDYDCCQTLRRNLKTAVIASNIASVSADNILDKAQLRARDVSVLIGGPPCQPFSKSGYWATGGSKRLDDPRASTLAGFFGVVERVLPRAFLLENVEGLGYRGKNEGLALIEKKVGKINKQIGTNYHLASKVLNAADYGVPQNRRRLFLVGSRDGRIFKFPAPTHYDPLKGSAGELLRRHVTAWEALYGAPSSQDEELGLSGKWADLLCSIPEGCNYLWHTSRMGGLPLFGWRTRYWSFLLKLAKNRPAWTLQAQPGPATGPFHWSNRRLSVAEMCRLQTFPSKITLAGSYSSARRQLGNAVPSLLAEVLAREIRRQLFNGPASVRRLKLAIPLIQDPIPAPEPINAVARKYLPLIGNHSAHPGHGLGPRASRASSFEEQLELPAE